MRHFTMAALALCVATIALGAEEVQQPDGIPSRSAFILNGGLAHDLDGDTGWIVRIGNLSFIGVGPWYWGFCSTTGGFVSSGESVMETSVLAGCRIAIAEVNAALDLSLDFVAFGGRVEADTMRFRVEAPALQPSASLVFLADRNTDISLGAWALLRPYDAEGEAWDFSRSYWGISFSVAMKTFRYSTKRPWAESLAVGAEERLTEAGGLAKGDGL